MQVHLSLSLISAVVYEIQDESRIAEKAHVKDLEHYWPINPDFVNEKRFSQLENEGASSLSKEISETHPVRCRDSGRHRKLKGSNIKDSNHHRAEEEAKEQAKEEAEEEEVVVTDLEIESRITWKSIFQLWELKEDFRTRRREPRTTEMTDRS